jgi:transcriptional regulator with GAF, ATPase, and Fis domain
MKSAAIWEDNEIVAANSTEPNGEATPAASQNKIELLTQMAFQLFREMQSLSEVPTLNIDAGLDFYDEVTRFEVDLITRALLRTGGHQGRAARLLNLKVTTLNSKIKHYDIKLEAFAPGHHSLATPDWGSTHTPETWGPPI